MDVNDLIIFAIIAFGLFSSINKKKKKGQKGFFASIIYELQKNSQINLAQINYQEVDQTNNNLNENISINQNTENQNTYNKTTKSTTQEIEVDKSTIKEDNKTLQKRTHSDIKKAFIFKELIEKPISLRRGNRRC